MLKSKKKHKCSCKDIPKFKSNGPKNSIAPSVQKNLKKVNKESINTNMSKSLFEKLFEEVMQDDNEALGLPSADTGMGDDSGGMGEDMGGDMGEDSVTLTLNKDLAKQLLEVLKSVVGEEEEEVAPEMEGEGEGEGEMEGDGDSYDDEAAEDEEGEDDDEASEDEDDDEDEKEKSKKLHTEAPQAGYEDFGVDSKSKVLQGKGQQKVASVASHTSAAKGEGKQTAGTAHYMPAPKYKQKDLTVDSNVKPSGKDKSVFNRD